MPELPEVETIARTLAPQVLGRSVSGIALLLPKTLAAGAAHVPFLPGRAIERVWRRGKLLVMELAPSIQPGSGLSAGAQAGAADVLRLVFHLKMTGRLFVHPCETPPHAHTRMLFALAAADGSENSLLFFDDVRTFGYCRIMTREECEGWSFWRELGPEPLELAEAEFAARFSPRRGKIKALLLNQTCIAGIGNIYADEALFRAGIRPDAPADSLSVGRLERLGRAVKDVLAESIEQCGSSIRDYRDANGNAGAFQNTFRVYGRSGQGCVECGAPLEKNIVAGRTTIFCGQCQT